MARKIERKEHDVRTGIIVVLAISFIMAMLEYYGAFAGLEGRLHDWSPFLHHNRPEMSKIVVLEIDKQAYDTLFHSNSPISPATLTSIVNRIASANPAPAVVGVDVLTTSEAGHGEFYRDFAKRIAKTEQAARIVWSAGPDDFKPHAVNPFAWLLGREDEPVIRPTEVLGYGLKDLNCREHIRWGPALAPTERDLKIRRFPKEIRVSDDVNSVECSLPRPSFTQVITTHYCASHRAVCNLTEGDDIYLSASGPRPTSISLDTIFALAKDGTTVQPKLPFDKYLGQLFDDKIVLIGGTFPNSNDFHETSEGQIPGIFIHAQAIASEISGLSSHSRYQAAV